MAIASLDEALRAAERISALSEKIRGVPGLGEGHVGRLHASLASLARDYGKRPWWHHRFLVRELDPVALEVKGLASRSGLSREHLEVFDAVLYSLKHRRFRAVAKLLPKLEEPLSWVQQRERLREEYRPFRRRLEEESEALRQQILGLQNVPAPEAGPEEVEAAERLIESCNRAFAEAMRRFLARAPARDVVRACLQADSAPGLPAFAPPDSEAARGLLTLLEREEGEAARMDLYDLVEASGYSEARFAHLAPGSPRLHRALKSSATWLRSLARAPEAAGLSIRDPPENLRQRISSVLRFLAAVPGAGDAVQPLRSLETLAETGRLAAVQRSAQVYREHGEAAGKRWDGTLGAEMEEKQKALADISKSLRELPEA